MPFDSSPAFTIPAVETDEVLQRLLRGREKVARGWCQWALVDADHSVCARGALFHATRTSQWHGNADDGARRTDAFLAGFVPARFKGLNEAVVAFNNDSRTTHVDILALFDRAISARRGELS